VAELGPNFWGGGGGGKWTGGLKNELQADFKAQFGPIPIENKCFFPVLGGHGPFGLHEAPPLLGCTKQTRYHIDIT
jgi:hypothetical protein